MHAPSSQACRQEWREAVRQGEVSLLHALQLDRMSLFRETRQEVLPSAPITKQAQSKAALLCRAAREWKTIRILSEVWVTDTVAAGRAMAEAPYIVPLPEPPQIAQRPAPPQPDSNHHQHAQVPHRAMLGDGPDAIRRTGAQQQQQQPSHPGSRLPPQRPGSAALSARPQPAAKCTPASTSEQHHQQHARASAEDQKFGSKAPELTG